jgi:hypothetical protein
MYGVKELLELPWSAGKHAEEVVLLLCWQQVACVCVYVLAWCECVLCWCRGTSMRGRVQGSFCRD